MGSGAAQPYNTVPFDRRLQPRVIYWAQGGKGAPFVTNANKAQWLSINDLAFVWQRADGSWIVQSKPLGSPLPAIFYTPEQRLAAAAYVASSQNLTFTNTDHALDASYDLENLREGAPVQQVSAPAPSSVLIKAELALPSGKVLSASYLDGATWHPITV